MGLVNRRNSRGSRLGRLCIALQMMTLDGHCHSNVGSSATAVANGPSQRRDV